MYSYWFSCLLYHPLFPCSWKMWKKIVFCICQLNLVIWSDYMNSGFGHSSIILEFSNISGTARLSKQQYFPFCCWQFQPVVCYKEKVWVWVKWAVNMWYVLRIWNCHMSRRLFIISHLHVGHVTMDTR